MTNNYNVTTIPGTLIITDENVDPSLIVTKKDGKEDEDDYKYQEGEEVTFTINPDKPQIKSAGNSDDNVLILVNKKDPTKKAV